MSKQINRGGIFMTPGSQCQWKSLPIKSQQRIKMRKKNQKIVIKRIGTHKTNKIPYLNNSLNNPK